MLLPGFLFQWLEALCATHKLQYLHPEMLKELAVLRISIKFKHISAKKKMMRIIG